MQANSFGTYMPAVATELNMLCSCRWSNVHTANASAEVCMRGYACSWVGGMLAPVDAESRQASRGAAAWYTSR